MTEGVRKVFVIFFSLRKFALWYSRQNSVGQFARHVTE